LIEESIFRPLPDGVKNKMNEMAKATQAASAKSLKKTASKPAAKSAPKPAPKKPALSLLTSQVELVKYLSYRLAVSQVQAKDFLDTFRHRKSGD
jgi:hypothetical protein